MKTVLNVKTDKEVKIKAQKLAKSLGIPLSTVVNAYLKEFIREEKLTLSIEPQLRPEVARFLVKASADAKKGKNIIGPFETGKEMDAYLNSR